MEVGAADLARVPGEHVRVRRAEFADLWIAAERLYEAQVSRRVADWYAFGVVATCRWLAGATVRTVVGRWEPARSPVTERAVSATPELVEAEFLAAQVWAMRRPVPLWLAERAGWVEGVVATLDWAWRGSGVPPLPADTGGRARGGVHP